MWVQGAPAPGWIYSMQWLNLCMWFTVFWAKKHSWFAVWMFIWGLHMWVPARPTVFKLWLQLVQPLPSFLGSVPYCFLQASHSNPMVDTISNLMAPNLFCSIRINIPLKALPSEDDSPLQLPSALAKTSLLTLTHRTSFSFISFIWGNSWTTPAVSLCEHFGKWGDNLSPSWALRLAGGGSQVK